MPAGIKPMKAALADRPPAGPGWLYEIKWDGVRGIGFVRDERLRIQSRSGGWCEKQYPELAVVPHFVAAREAILDGEIAVLDRKGAARFGLIQPRIAQHDPNAIAHLVRSHPVLYFVFDLLYLDGYDLRKADLIERKRLLAEVVTPSQVLRISDHFEDAGQELLEAARENELEGIIAKRARSCYEQRRSSDWVKVKVNQQQEFIICGLTRGEREYFSSLVLGVYDRGKLSYVGCVGTGFDSKTIAGIYRQLEPLVTPRSPFGEGIDIARDVTWVRPELVCMVKFLNWTTDGRLRAPVFAGLRYDVEPQECIRERPGEAPPEEAPAPVKREQLLAAGPEEATLRIGGRPLKFTNLNKVFYPADGYTKRDLLNYYDAVADLILPHIKDRPLSLKRYPNGIHDEFFFQKNSPESFPDWMRYELIDSEHARRPIRYVLAEDRASLLYLVNLGCIDQNPWQSRVGSLSNPDWILIDLDPQGCEYERIIDAALLVRRKLDFIGLEGYPKTTGGDGLHIYVPVAGEYTYEQTRTVAELLAMAAARERPDLFTTPRAVAKREQGKVYFDYLQNAESKTIAAPYVVRAYNGAPVATPLAWREVKPGLMPSHFTVRNAPARFEQVGDLFAPVLANKQRLENCLDKLEQLVSGR
jgi:bifunctional non-homologous end joining protein LigD